ncbi:MAG: hypothetical protein H6922_04695 [Pseudomonadaceae bacterium]|nr:hypothetical protein [Pseudomonadaceae bacterium]
MFPMLLWSYRLIVACMAGALVYDFYSGQVFGYGTDATMRGIVILAVLAEPAFWAVTHLFGGVLMGVAAGGLLDGMKLSLILGLGLGVARTWPYVAAAAAGAYAGEGPLLYSIGGAVLAVLLFGMDKAITWMWQQARHNNA